MLVSVVLMSSFSASITSVEVKRHFATLISTCKVERMEEYRFLQKRKKNNGLTEASGFQELSVNIMDFLCYPVHT